MDHVRTQIPYALLGGTAAALIGVLPAGFGLPWFILLPLAAVTLVVVHRFLGKKVDVAHASD
jgi:Na+/H+ antiporter NhaC